VLAKARPGVDLIQYLCWFHVYSRAPMEVIAKTRGIPLDAPKLPQGEDNRHSAIYEDLSLRLTPPPAEDAFAGYAEQIAHRTAVYLERLNRYGSALKADDLADVNALLGTAYATNEAADGALEAWIGEADAGAG